LLAIFGLRKNKRNNVLKMQDSVSLETERLLTAIASRYIHIIPDEIDHAILESLEKIQNFTLTDRAYIYMFRQNNKRLKLEYIFSAPGNSDKIAQHDRIDSADFEWMMRELNVNQAVVIETISDLPSAASTVKLIMEAEHTKSMILIPLNSQNILSGVIGLDATKGERVWPDYVKYLLSKSGEIFMKVLEHKKPVQGVSEREADWEKVFENVGDAIIIWNPAGRIMRVNPAGVKLFGYDSEEEMQKLKFGTDLTTGQKEYERYFKILQEEGQVKEYRFNFKHKNGSKIVTEITATTIHNNSGKVTAFSGIIRDVTEKLTLEQEFFQSQKMESIGLLAGGIAHDFNNILTAITGYSDLLARRLGEAHPLHRIAKNILEASGRAENLIRQLLGFSRKQMIKPKVININDEIRDLNKMLSRLVQESISFEMNLSEGLKNIVADPVQIQQILVNLVVNAVHAIKDDRGRKKEYFIRITTREENLRDKFIDRHTDNRTGEQLLISVEDNGIGMDEETVQKIFDPFFSTKEEGMGTGLGLATVYGIVKQNNAYIHVDSSPGEGTIFKIYWPTTSEQKKTEEKEPVSEPHKTHSECILVVEDDKSVRDLACTALKSLGYEVFEAKDGLQALQIIEKHDLIKRLDLLFTDIIMPEMRGDELAYKVHEMNPDIKILLSSGYTESQIYFKGDDRQTGYFKLNKPYTIRKLESKIRSVLNHRV